MRVGGGDRKDLVGKHGLVVFEVTGDHLKGERGLEGHSKIWLAWPTPGSAPMAPVNLKGIHQN